MALGWRIWEALFGQHTTLLELEEVVCCVGVLKSHIAERYLSFLKSRTIHEKELPAISAIDNDFIGTTDSFQ